MRTTRAFGILVAAALLAASWTVLADDGSDEPELRGAPEGRSAGHARGASANATEGSDEDHRGEGAEARAFQRGQQEARKTFEEEHDDDCDGTNGTALAQCQRNLSAARRDFHEEQREEFEQEREELRERAAEERLGRFALAQGSFVGTYVSFSWDAGNASVLDHTVGGCLVFDRIQLRDDSASEVQVEKRGRVVAIATDDARLKLHDNPGGVLNARSEDDASIVFTLDEAITATLNKSKVRLQGCGNWTATLHGDDLAMSGRTLTLEGHATFVAHDDDPTLPPVSREHRAELERAKEHRTIGGEVVVVGRDADDIAEVELDANVSLEAQHTSDGLRVVVNGTGAARTIVLNVGAGIVKGDRVVVRYYDEANGTFHEVGITKADSLADVLDPSGDEGPEYWVVHDDSGTQVLVSVPRWSVHAFTVQGVAELVQPSVLAGAFAAVLFVAVAGAALVRKRKP